MVERLSYKEILERYPNEYVLLNEPETDNQQRVVSGELLCHDKDRKVVGKIAGELKPRNSAFFYTGKPPTNVALAL